MTAPWDSGVEGDQVLPLINLDAETIRVEAGPGTGKTFGLARRVVRIMHPEGLAASGRDVLVVAFNRVIAKQLKADIGQALATTGTPHEYPPTILTVHALCLQAIGENVRILLPHEREAMLYDVLHEFPEIGTKYGRKSTAEQALRDHEAKLQENVALWQAVSRWLRRHRARLISELPGMLLDHIQGGDFPDRRYRYVIVDEFQDLTRGEQRLFLMLKAKAGQFVALGDPRQSIYAFRGNDREGLKKIESTIGGPVTDLPMTQCRRCPSQVVEAANQLMSLVPGPRLVPASTVEGNTHVVVWKTPQGEADGMARAILTNLRAHPQDRHLVMVTRRQFGFMLRGKIAELDDSVAVDLCFSESLLESWPVREAFLFFCLLVDPDPPTWRAWLGYQNSPQASSPLAPSRNAGAYLRLLRENGDEITAEVVRRLATEPRYKGRGPGGVHLWDRAKRFIDLRREAVLEGASPAEFLERLFAPESWTEGSAERDVAKLDMELMRQKAMELALDVTDEEKEQPAEMILQGVAQRLRYYIATREPFAPTKEAGAVQVATLWGAKGVTADHAYLLGLCQEAIPGTRREEYPGTEDEHVEEQRRLFYVSITRSKKTLVLSRAQKIRPGDALKLGLAVRLGRGHWVDLLMCPFLRDILRLLPPAQHGETWVGC